MDKKHVQYLSYDNPKSLKIRTKSSLVKELEFVVNLVSSFPALLYENLFLFFTYFAMIYTFNSLFMVKKQVQYLSYDIHKFLKIMTKSYLVKS